MYELRTKVKMTQKELAARVGTTPSAIARLENDYYDGHSRDAAPYCGGAQQAGRAASCLSRVRAPPETGQYVAQRDADFSALPVTA